MRLAPLGTARNLESAARQLRARLDPDGVDRFDPAAAERRFLDLTTDSMGMLVGRFQLDAVAGATVRAAIDAASAPAPWGPDGTTRDDRSPRQRRADALSVLAEAALAAGGPHRGERPRVVVHVRSEDLVSEDLLSEDLVTDDRVGVASQGGEAPAGAAGDVPYGAPRLESGQPLDRITARGLACDAVVHLLSQEPGTGRVLDVGREYRFATPSQRIALATREGMPHTRVRRPACLVRRPPRPTPGGRRGHGSGQPGPAVSGPPHRGARRALAGPDGGGRSACGDPTSVGRSSR